MLALNGLKHRRGSNKPNKISTSSNQELCCGGDRLWHLIHLHRPAWQKKEPLHSARWKNLRQAEPESYTPIPAVLTAFVPEYRPSELKRETSPSLYWQGTQSRATAPIHYTAQHTSSSAIRCYTHSSFPIHFIPNTIPTPIVTALIRLPFVPERSFIETFLAFAAGSQSPVCAQEKLDISTQKVAFLELHHSALLKDSGSVLLPNPSNQPPCIFAG